MIEVAVLERVEVRRDGAVIAVPGGLTSALLVRLALDAGRRVRAERLLDELWSGPSATRRNTLQAKVSQLRRALGDPALLPGGAAGYTLAVAPGAVDALEALRLADAGSALLAGGDPAAAAATCREGLALFGAEVLPAAGVASWVVPHRGRLEQARLQMVEDELAARLALGAAGEVTGELEALVAVHPLRERLWSMLVTALYRAGRQSDALAAHRRVTALLADELGVDPGPELAAVGRLVLVQDPALDPAPGRGPGDGAPSPSVPAPAPGNVPAPAAPLVGRTADLEALRATLDAHRLVTLVGPAGVGKTRLAIEAAQLGPAGDGAWLVRLEGVRTAAELPAALAEAVPGVRGVEDLRGAELLLVLDNCEHLPAAAGLAAQVLDTAPRVRVLATSQRPLGLDTEHVQLLAPLPEPDAVALFAQHAARRRPSFALTARTAPAVASLCRALDGLPLAIELAAARTRILSVSEIAQRLDDRFTLLADPTSARPARLRTLAAALSWSYDLLFPDDQRGLWAIAQFPGGATMSGIEHVLAALDVPAASALDVVERLVDRSLATAEPGAGATRYRLLDSVRAFALDRAAAAGAGDVAADAVLDWVARLADTVTGRIRGPGQGAAVATTAAERATIDVALARARSHDPVTGLRIAVGFGWAWVLLDDPGAAARLRAARLAAPTAPSELTVRALLLESWHEAMSGDLVAARTALDTATGLLTGGEPLADLARWYGGFVLQQEGRPAESLRELQRCREAFASRGETWEEGGSVLLSAFAHLAVGDTAAGRAACEEALRLLVPLGDTWALLHAEGALGRIAEAEQRFADAAEHHARAARSAENHGFPGAAALHLTNLGRAQHGGRDPAAATTLRVAVAAAEREGDLRLLAVARVALAEVLLSAGDRAGARELLVRADRWYAASGAGDGAAHAAGLLAALDAGPVG
ncbi:AfsR/SARP family transcriptional regulator [Pseudonocardia sp.]|uniref:AfsR/SARP family transcriptional regulator n=1 Tax=Pseudonocardia sp. TaxID=60912 RepID=UPI003D1502BD